MVVSAVQQLFSLLKTIFTKAEGKVETDKRNSLKEELRFRSKSHEPVKPCRGFPNFEFQTAKVELTLNSFSLSTFPLCTPLENWNLFTLLTS